MTDFYRRALKKLDKLDNKQRSELLVSVIEEVSLLENVLDSVNAGILVCNETDHIVMVNKYALRFLPLKYSEGIHIFDAIKDERLIELLKEIFASGEKAIDRELDIVIQGRYTLLSITAVPFVKERRIIGSVIHIEDITEKRKEESRLRRAENLASLTTLAAGVAHEIKNPLGSISIHLQLLQKLLTKEDKPVKKAADKYFDVLNEEIDRLNRIVVDFLFAVRPMTLELREGDINKIISHMVDFVQYEMEQAGIQCRLELDENLPRILIDERYMKHALLNLVTNAKASMPQGGSITFITSCIDNEIKISVIDTGIGIRKEDLSKIFEPYFTTKETGTGLGLTQVFKIIREHQGEITVNSKRGKGTCFDIILPVPRKQVRMIAYNETDNRR